jgi:hypothetical protein
VFFKIEHIGNKYGLCSEFKKCPGIYSSLVYRFKIWALVCGQKDLTNDINVNPENYRLRAAHFEDKMFADAKKSTAF